jgi:hypothetical protein
MSNPNCPDCKPPSTPCPRCKEWWRTCLVADRFPEIETKSGRLLKTSGVPYRLRRYYGLEGRVRNVTAGAVWSIQRDAKLEYYALAHALYNTRGVFKSFFERKVWRLHCDGKSQRTIALMLDVTRRKVRWVIDKFAARIRYKGKRGWSSVAPGHTRGIYKRTSITRKRNSISSARVHAERRMSQIPSPKETAWPKPPTKK